MLEQRIAELKAIIARNDGRNAADPRFSRAVDDLISAFYDDIGRITDVPSRALFDLLVIKVLYVGRGSCHAGVIDYLGELLDSYLYARELFPLDAAGRPQSPYFTDVLSQEGSVEEPASRYEAYRGYADRALFLSGVFRRAVERRRPPRPSRLAREHAPGVDGAYYVTTGKTMYRMASQQREAQDRRDTLERLAGFFEVYAGALAEMSERYIMGFDLDLVADKMLDSLNNYRRSREPRSLDEARHYAAILQVDAGRFGATAG